MDVAEVLRFARWILLVAAVPVAWAQSEPSTVAVVSSTPVATVTPAAVATPTDAPAPEAAPSKARVARTTVLPKATIRFADEKTVLGMPLAGSRSRPHCSTDGMTFFDLSAGSSTSDVSAAPLLFRVSTEGEVKRLLRKLPPDFSKVTVRDFFAGDQTLVTLLEATKRDDGTSTSPPRETEYFMSISDHEGDLSSLVQLEVRFKPLKIARFGAGDFIVLGWDEGNLQPMLALLKEDGTVRRFLDLEVRRTGKAREGSSSETQNETVSEQTHSSLDSLQGAAFVAYGNELLLTYPGTNKPIRVLNPAGDGRTIPIVLPGGFVLHDVLVSGSRGSLVVRAGVVEDPDKPASEVAQDSQLRLFEVSTYTGAPLREFIVPKPRVADVACAVNSSLTAIFYDTIANADRPSAIDGKTYTSLQLVIATARR